MDEEKICPINPHGNGYCKKDKCALWDTTNCSIKTAADSIIELAVTLVDYGISITGDS